MPITVEAYRSPVLSAVDPGTNQSLRLVREEALVTGLGNGTGGNVFLPMVPEASYTDVAALAGETFGPAAEEMMTMNQGLRDAVRDGNLPDGLRVLGGYCALPKQVNASLEPGDMPGTSVLEIRGDNGAPREVPLPKGLAASVDFLIAEAPPITLPNLVSTATPTGLPTTLFAEVGFYTDWTLGKLVRNLADMPPASEIEDARDKLRVFFEDAYARAATTWSRLRNVVMRGAEVSVVTQVSDLEIADAYESAVRQLCASAGFALDAGPIDSAVKAAGFYSPAIVKALRSAGALGSQELAIIAEGQGNLVIPKNERAFNIIRRGLFATLAEKVGFWGDQAADGGRDWSTGRPALISYAPMTYGPLWAKQPLDVESPYAVPNAENYAGFVEGGPPDGFPENTNALVDLRQNWIYLLGTAMPQDQAVRECLRTMEDVAARPLGDFGGDTPKGNKQVRSRMMVQAADATAVAVDSLLRRIFDEPTKAGNA